MNPIRQINFNGYIDDAEWFGDEITPGMLQEQLYGTSGGEPTDVHILLNSYGGSCNAAIRMHDMIKAYPGNVLLTISGTAASAATVVSMAADRLEMTPGSLFMVHDPIMMTYGNEAEIMIDVEMLRTCKASILNVYQLRSPLPRDDIAALMTTTTWMDAQAALENGFIDRITQKETNSGAVANAARASIINRKDAEQKVAAFYDRKRPKRIQQHAPDVKNVGVPFAQLSKRLNLLRH